MKVLVLQTWRDDYHIVRPEIEMILGLKKKGVDIHVTVNSAEPNTKYFVEAGIPTHELFFDSRYSANKIKQLRALIKQEKFDIIHAIYNKSLANVIPAIKGMKIPLAAYRGATINWTDPTNYQTFLHPRLNTIICLSKAVEKNVKQSLKFWNTPTVQIYKGQELSWFQEVEAIDLASEFHLPKNAFVVALASSVRRVKGVEYLLKATYDIPTDLPIYFLLAGNKTDQPSLQKLKENSPIADRIQLLGHRSDVLSIIKASDCFVLPTIGIEGLSRSVIEAMMLKTPVISTKCGGPEELITDNKTGLLVEKKDGKAIADAILRLYHNKDLRETLANNAQQNIVKNFNVQQSIDKTYDLYQQLLQP